MVLQQLGAPGPGGSVSREKGKINAYLQTFVDTEHHFDAVVAHRDAVFMLAKYLPQAIDGNSEGKDLSSLPSFIIKALFDFIGNLHAVLRDIVHGPASFIEVPTRRSGGRSRSDSISGMGAGGLELSGQQLFRRMDEIIGRHNRVYELVYGVGSGNGGNGGNGSNGGNGGDGASGASGISGISMRNALTTAQGVNTAGGLASSPPVARRAPFVVEEPLVQQVMEMGFDRSEIVRAANALRSNDAGEVTGFLLEGGEMYGEGIEFVLDDEMDETAAAAAAVTAAAAGGDANPSLLAGSTVEANTTAENQALDSHVPASSLNDGDTAARATGGGDRGSNSAASLGGDERTRALTEAAKIAPPPQNLRWVVKIAPLTRAACTCSVESVTSCHLLCLF